MRNTDTNTECEGAALALPAAHQTADDSDGIAWWNGMSVQDRRFWLAAAASAVPADAWACFKSMRAEAG